MHVFLVILLIQSLLGKEVDEKIYHEVSSSFLIEVIQEEILYKKRNSSESDEYAEGGYYLYGIEDSSSSLLFDGVFIDYSEAWITVNNQYVLFTISGIILLDENKELIERFDFKETELVIGAQYNRSVNRVYFLLKNLERNQIDLCQYSFDNKELKKVIEGIGIDYENIEEPFKKMFFASDNELFIEDYCYNFWRVNLKDNSISKVNLDGSNCYGYSLVGNDKGLVYLDMDEQKVSYELREYNFTTHENILLLDGKNQYSKPVYVELFSTPGTSSFLVQIDDKLFLYDYSSFKEVKVGVSEILHFSEGYLIYIDFSGEVKGVFLEK